jgi:hypothetical protein
MIFFFFQSSAYQFFLNALQLLQFVQDYVTAEPQSFQLRLTCAVTYILICLAVSGQQFCSGKHASKLFYHPQLSNSG